MKCPICGYAGLTVTDSRAISEDRVIRRRRRCVKCGSRVTTYERQTPAELAGALGNVQTAKGAKFHTQVTQMNDLLVLMAEIDRVVIMHVARRMAEANCNRRTSPHE